jgi:hypothetical protein
VITSGSLIRNLIEFVKSQQKLKHMVVFCGNKSKHEELLDHDIVMAVEDDFLALLNKIQEAIEKIERKEIESFDANSYQDRFTDFRRSASATEKRLNLSCISETVIERVD